MYSLVYEPGIPGVKPIDLSGVDYTVGQATGLRSTSWTYTLAAAGLSGVSASARETTLTVSARTPELFDRPGMIFDAEMSLGEPGTLVIDDQWRQRCYVTKTSTTSASRIVGAPSTQSWTVVLLDGVWSRLLPVEHFNPVTSTATGLDLPTDLPLDLAAGGYTRYIQNDSLAPVDWRMTVFGPATDPHITIGSNIIELTGSIPDGSYATIDSRRRTITLTDGSGSTRNVFDWGVRSTGVGSGHYVFERIPAGQQVVSWPSSFSFDMQLLEERTDPTWGGMRIIPVDAIHPDPITVGYCAGTDALARTTTVKWSDGHTSVEPIMWEPLTGTDTPGATIIAKGTARGQYLTQKITVQPDLLDVSKMGQFAFENGPNYDSRWYQQSDGGWTYDNPSDSGISEYAGRSFGGHMGGANPNVDSRLLIPAGDYTLIIPVTRASGFPIAPAPHSIDLSYRISSDGEKWDSDVYYRAQWWTQPDAGSELRMKVHMPQSGYFGCSLSFVTIPGTVFQFGKPMLVRGTLDGAVECLEHAAWPSKDFYAGDKKASHIDADDPSILDVGVVPSAYEYGAARSTLSDLQANHRYEIRFEARYAPNSAHASGEMYVGINKAGVIMWSAHLDLSKVTDDWVEHTVQFGPVDAAQATGITQIVTVKPDGDSTATVQLRDFRLTDITSQVGVDDSVDPWLVSWDQLGYAGDHVDLSVSAGSYTSQWSTGKTPISAGHTYALTLTAQGSDGTLSLHLRDQWDIGAAFTATGSTETYTAQFTAANDVRSMQDVCLYLDHAASDARWTVYGLRLEDLTASNGAAGGSVEHAGLTFTAANWGGKPDASDPTILDVAVPTKTGIFYLMPYPVDADTRYHVSFLIRLTGGEPHDGKFWLAFNGAKLWAPTTISLADLTGDWQYREFTFTVPDGDFSDSSLILNAFEATTAENVSIQISRLQINKLGGRLDDALITWRQVGFKLDDDVLSYRSSGKLTGKSPSSIEADDPQITRTYPRILHVKPSHTYVLSVDANVDSSHGIGDDRLFVQLGGATWDWLDVWVLETPTDGWHTFSKKISVPSTAAEATVPVNINSTDSHARLWRLKNLRFEDTTG